MSQPSDEDVIRERLWKDFGSPDGKPCGCGGHHLIDEVLEALDRILAERDRLREERDGLQYVVDATLKPLKARITELERSKRQAQALVEKWRAEASRMVGTPMSQTHIEEAFWAAEWFDTRANELEATLSTRGAAGSEQGHGVAGGRHVSHIGHTRHLLAIWNGEKT